MTLHRRVFARRKTYNAYAMKRSNERTFYREFENNHGSTTSLIGGPPSCTETYANTKAQCYDFATPYVQTCIAPTHVYLRMSIKATALRRARAVRSYPEAYIIDGRRARITYTHARLITRPSI